jgi:PAS domain S-box-containing protein
MNDQNETIKLILNEVETQDVLQAIAGGISIQDTNFKILYQNIKHKSLLGEHIGEYCYQAYQKRDGNCDGCPMVMTFKDGLIHTCERIVSIHGEISYFAITSSPLKDKTGRIIAGLEVVRDITELKRNEETLKTSEEKFRSLFSAEQDAIIIVESETRRIIDVNDSALRLYGYSKEEILKLTGPDLSAEPEKSSAAIKEIATETDKYIHYHTRNHKTKDGTIFPVEISSGTFFLEGKKIVSAMIRDITERKKAEEQVQSIAKFPSENPNPVLRISSENTILYKNAAVNKLLKEEGLSKSEKDIFKILPDNLNAFITQALESKQEVSMVEVKVGNKVFAYNIIPIVDQKYVNLYGRDITDRKKAEANLIESEERYQTLFNQASDAILVFDVDSGEMLNFNDKAHENLEYTREEFIKVNLSDIDIVESAEEIAEHIKKIIKEGSDSFETKHRTKSGRIMDVVVNSKITQIRGKNYIQSTLFDITDRKKAEDELQKTHNELELRVKERTLELQEKNIALKVLLKQREEDKNELEQNILSNVKSLIQPYLFKLKRNNSNIEDVAYLNIIESNLEDIISPFSQKLSSNYMKFTSKEIEIASLIKEGKKDKEIMEIMNIAFDTVKGHRKNIRKKLGIHGKGTNLRNKLLSI